jgi:hypothetical protein
VSNVSFAIRSDDAGCGRFADDASSLAGIPVIAPDVGHRSIASLLRCLCHVRYSPYRCHNIALQ